MKKVDIVRLRLKGVSNEEIKELIELEALAEDGEKDPDEKDPDEKDPDEKDPDEKDPDEKDPDEKDPDEKDPDEKKDPPSGIDKAKKEIEELKKKLAAAQKANSQKDVSGGTAPKDTDQDIFNKAVASFM